MSKFTQILPEVINRICSAYFGTTNAKYIKDIKDNFTTDNSHVFHFLGLLDAPAASDKMQN